MLIEQQKRLSRVRFRHPIRVVTLDGQPRVIRTLTANVSRKGLFLRMPEPLPLGTKVALSLEAGGRALALAQAEVVWGRKNESQLPGRFPGCGVRFTEFMNPRASELVEYLVLNLDQGKPLRLAPRERRWARWLPLAAVLALVLCGVAAVAIFARFESDDLVMRDALPPASAELLHEPRDTAAPLAGLEAGSAAAQGAPRAELSAIEGAPPPAAGREESALELAAPAEPEASASVELGAALTAAAPREQPAVAAPPGEARAATPQGAGPALPAAEARAEPASPATAAATDQSDVPGPARAPAPAALPTARAAAREASGPGAAVEAAGTAGARALGQPTAGPANRAQALRRDGSTPAASTGGVALPSGAAARLGWKVTGAALALTLQLAPRAGLARAFVLADPPRAVFDLAGESPDLSHQITLGAPHTTGVRLGKLSMGTRVVVDLDRAPSRVSQAGTTLLLSY